MHTVFFFLSFNSINEVPLKRKNLAIVKARKNLSSSSPGHSEGNLVSKCG